MARPELWQSSQRVGLQLLDTELKQTAPAESSRECAQPRCSLPHARFKTSACDFPVQRLVSVGSATNFPSTLKYPQMRTCTLRAPHTHAAQVVGTRLTPTALLSSWGEPGLFFDLQRSELFHCIYLSLAACFGLVSSIPELLFTRLLFFFVTATVKPFRLEAVSLPPHPSIYLCSRSRKFGDFEG